MKKWAMVFWMWYFFVMPKQAGTFTSVGLPMLVETKTEKTCLWANYDLTAKGYVTTTCREAEPGEKILLRR